MKSKKSTNNKKTVKKGVSKKKPKDYLCKKIEKVPPKQKVKKCICEDIADKKKDKPVKKNYVDNSLFTDLIYQFYKSGEISNELGEMIYKIATRLAYSPNFINYSYREEMIGDAIVKMINALRNKKFKKTKGHAFSYFTKIAFNAFRNRIKKEKRTHEAQQHYQEETYEHLVSIGYIPYTGHTNTGNVDEDFEGASNNND